jgi:3-polyprenyl-4-hydroxybenzoate decarboxylase
MDTTQRLKEKAIEQMKRRLRESAPRPQASALAHESPAMVEDGHLQDPPVYPTYKTDPGSLITRADAEGIWVSWEQKEAEGLAWNAHSALFTYAELR